MAKEIHGDECMSIAQCLPEINSFFMQDCPLCGRSNRMVVQCVYRSERNLGQVHPDMGYSFCNCKNIFYTDYDNVAIGKDGKKLDVYDRIKDIKESFDKLNPGWRIRFVTPDPYFCEWGQDPHTFLHWNPRKFHVLWDMEQFIEEIKSIGINIESCRREFEVDAKFPQ